MWMLTISNGSSRADLRSNLRPVPEKSVRGPYGICYEEISALLHFILNLIKHDTYGYSGSY